MVIRSGVLKNKPLIYVLASVRFQPWMLLPSKIAEIQDRLREDFPIFNNIQISRGDLGPNPVPDSLQSYAWAFHQSDRKAGCQISSDQIIVHCTNYESFDNFSKIISRVIDSVLEHSKNLDAVAIGIRYLDLIKVKENEKLADFLPKELLPYEKDSLGMKVSGGHTLTTYETTTGFLQARFWTGNNFMTVPDDLVPIYLLTKEISPTKVFPISPLQEGEGILDTDSIWSTSTPSRMSNGEIIKKFTELHAHANTFFRTVCTEFAFKTWQEEL